MAGAGDERHRRRAADDRGHALGERREFPVTGAGDQQHRGAQGRKPVPQRLLGAGAVQPQAGGKAVGGVGQPPGPPGPLRRQAGEQRLGEPTVQEPLQADPLELRGERLVGGPARGPHGRVVQAGRGADQDQRAHQVRPVQRQPQAQAPAERIANVGRGAARLAQQRGGLGEAGLGCRGAAVARQVDPDDRVAVAQPRGQGLHCGERLGEAVDQHHPIPRSPIHDLVQRHRGILS